LQGAFDLLTAPGRAAWLHSPIHSARAKRIVTLATLIGEANDLNRLIEENTRMLEELQHFGLQDFKRFAARLVER
jgi:hypothetical protein